MRLLLDANLSHRLMGSVEVLFPGSLHIKQTGLPSGASDLEVWQYAKEKGFVILTADSDFLLLTEKFGFPPKVIWLESCDYPTTVAARVIQENAAVLAQFDRNDQPLLILRAP
jgi:predicted nuclease of predicted toxin-antitoxin system